MTEAALVLFALLLLVAATRERFPVKRLPGPPEDGTDAWRRLRGSRPD